MVADRHVERIIIPGMRLGRRPHDPNRPALKLRNILTGVVPSHPTSADHLSKVTNWQMLGNDAHGDCGPAMEMHDRMLITTYLTGTTMTPDINAVYDLYKRSGNPGFPQQDNGVVLADMLSQVASGGIQGVKCLAYAQVDITNLDEIRAAISIFGSIHLGVDLEVAQQNQTRDGGPWDYQTSAEWGGHAVLAGLYTSDTVATHSDISVVTWGTTIGTTDNFWDHQTQEAWVVIWPEHLGTVEFQQGVDLAALAADYTALTGRPFPPTPTPPPPPTPQPITAAQAAANKQLAASAHTWLAQWHPMGRQLGQDLTAWLHAWGL